jgi:hypothetical protein
VRLEDWINPRHLATDAQALYRATLAGAPHASVVIDEFLRDDKLDLLRLVFAGEGAFEERHYLWEWTSGGRSEKTVSAEAWQSAAESQRAFVERVFTGARPEHRLGRGILTHFKFVDLLSSPEFMGFLESVSGIRPAALTGLLMRSMGAGHYIPPHSDFMPIRDLCGVFYISSGWQPRLGGRFRHCGSDAERVPIEPIANRLLLFEPQAKARHDVEPVEKSDEGWERWSYSIWFGRPDRAASFLPIRSGA